MCVDIQIKTTDKPFPTNGVSSYYAPVRSLNYWLRRPAPVLLVRYFVGEERGQCVWVKQYAAEVLGRRKRPWWEQSTVAVRFEEEFGPETAASIVTNLYRTERNGIVEQYRLLVSMVHPGREPNVLALGVAGPPHAPDELPVHVFPEEKQGALVRVQEIVGRVEAGESITTEEGEFAHWQIPRLIWWVARERAHISQCHSNLKQLGLAALRYAEDAGRLPAKETWAEELRPYLNGERADRVISCPLVNGGSYALYAPLSASPLPRTGRVPLFYDAHGSEDRGREQPPCPRHLGHAHVCMTDGRVELVPADGLHLMFSSGAPS